MLLHIRVNTLQDANRYGALSGKAGAFASPVTCYNIDRDGMPQLCRGWTVFLLRQSF